MRIYLSGIARGGSGPELHLKSPDIMMSYWMDVNTCERITKTNEPNRRLKELMMRVYLSGGGGARKHMPEHDLKKPDVMLSYWTNVNQDTQRADKRTKEVMKYRKGSRHSPLSCRSLFLDSGAHSLFNKYALKADGSINHDWYRTKEFWSFVDQYAEFVKRYKAGLDLYVTVDAIYNPEISWKSLRYLERQHGLKPIPVIHHKTEMHWIKKHMDRYEYIGLGGLGQKSQKEEYFSWADKVFKLICPKPRRIPIVKTHGFAMTSWELLTRYPWYSVDSASWIKSAAFGSIFVPLTTKGKYDFVGQPPWVIAISDGSPAKNKGVHLDSFKKRNPRYADKIENWVNFLDLPFGKTDDCGDSVEWGVLSDFTARAVANARFFQLLAKALPEWPWKYEPSRFRIPGFNIENPEPVNEEIAL